MTIEDVARHVGVSPMTVSRVINNFSGVRQSTRENVLRAVAELGYSPNPAARSLARHGGRRVGLLYSNPSAGYLSEFLVGALDGAQRSGSLLMIEKCGASEDSERAAIDRLVAGGVTGVILPSPHAESVTAHEQLALHNITGVAVGARLLNQQPNTVRIDDFAAAAEMTRHLLDLGHKRIGFIKGAANQSATAERLLGFETEIRKAGRAASALVEEGDFTYRSGLEAAMRLLASEQPPTAIFASNDDMAAGVMAAAHYRGRVVPGSLSVAGFDDTPIATAVWPELTTIHQPVAGMTETAVRILSEAARGKTPSAPAQPVDRLLPYKLVIRASTGPAPRPDAS
ncbi:LacI family DNA-binding transcriptional regulator [Alkalicaulis satelles]|uniref:LacI family DNA-binding transcriptional regulator n=1 Tax=Alkalicaulis satelles TaxID=2609175 RepID=UPI001E43D31E|nr:LacI family DNA-binding transcriptional regulator [Alkalicaulis satelles]